MKTDLYTKIVLTVIALALTVNLAKEFEFIPSVRANTTVASPSPMNVVAESKVIDVNIKSLGGVPIVNDYPYCNSINLAYGIPIGGAEKQSYPISINTAEEVIKVDISKIEGEKLSGYKANALPIKVANDTPLKVDISKVEGKDLSGYNSTSLPVRIEKNNDK